MVITILEAEVAPEWEDQLLKEYRTVATSPLPPYIVRSILARDTKAPNSWRIMTVFRSQEDLDEMRASGETPRGVAIFQAAQAQPTLAVLDIVDQFLNAS